MALFINNVVRPGPPWDQPAGDFHTAQLAIFLGFVNGLVSPAYMRGCLYDGAVEQQEMYYQLANFMVAMLGVALLLVDRTFSLAVVSSPLLPTPVVRGMMWFTKVLAGCIVQFGLNVMHLCLKMLYARLFLV